MISCLVSSCLLASALHNPAINHATTIAEEDFDASSLDSKNKVKKSKPSPLDDIEFVSEAEPSHPN